MGMMATVINSLALSSALGAIDVPNKVLTAIRMEPVGEFYTKWKAIEAMEEGKVVIMAAGTFVTGATNELSCDGPVCPPYTAYMQGGLTYDYGKLGIMRALDEMLDLSEKESLY